MKLVHLFLIYTSAALSASSASDLVSNGHFKRALPVVEQQLRSNPKDAESHYLMSKIKDALGEYEAAISHGEKAVELDAQSPEYHSFLAQQYGRAAQRASVFRRLGIARKCKQEAETALALDPKHLEANITLMVFLAQAPSVAGGDKDKADAIPDQIAKFDPAGAWIARGQLAQELGKSDQLEDYYRKAVEAVPKRYLANIRYANVLLNRKPPSFDIAEKHARLARSLNPDRVEGHNIFAAALAGAGKFPELDKALSEAEKQIPDNLLPYYTAARALIRDGKELTRAEAYLKKYAEKQPEARAPKLVHVHWSLGLVYEKLGRTADAVRELERALSLDRDFEPAAKDLKRLKG